jgi:hypothetical protein
VTQISRPFQIAIAAVALLLVVWLVALRGHSGGGGSTSSPPAAAATPAPASGSASASGAGASQSAPGGGSAASSGSIYHGSAPGVAGLTRAIAKARGAVKLSEQNAQQLQRQSAQASSAGPSSAAATATPSTAAAAPSGHGATASPSKPAGAKSATPAPTTGAAKKLASTTAKQSLVESELKSGRTVIVLFSSSKGAVDAVARGQLALLNAFLKSTASRPQNRDIAVHYSSPGEVGAYGTVTRSLQILQTPTILVITPSGRTKTLTGLVDAYAIRQAIKEARKP